MENNDRYTRPFQFIKLITTTCSFLLFFTITSCSGLTNKYGLLSNPIPTRVGEVEDVAMEYFIALCRAAQDGNLKEINRLTEDGVPVNQMGREGTPLIQPLYIAAKFGHLEVVERLLELGALIEVVDHRDRSPLYIAAKFGHVAVVDRLLELGALIEIVDRRGRSPLYIAAEYNRLEVVELLIENRAEVNVLDHNRNRPLHVAAKLGYSKIVDLLLINGALWNVANANGDTPLTLAKQHSNQEVVALLSCFKDLLEIIGG